MSGGLAFVSPDATFLQVVGVSLAVNVTPGPDMMFVAGQSLARGATAGRFAALGIAAGSLCHATLAAVGISSLIAASPRSLTVITWVGAAYLAWLGVSILRRSPVPATEPSAAGAAPTPVGTVFRQGLITNLLNPKVVLFYFALVPQFVRPEMGPSWQQVFVYGLTFNVLGTLVLFGVAGVSAWVAREFERPRLAAVLPKLSGAIFIVLAVRLLWH